MTNEKWCKILMILLAFAMILTVLQPTPTNDNEEKTTEAICTKDFDYIDLICNAINVLENINANRVDVNDEPIVNECTFTEEAVKIILCKVWES